MDLKCPHCKSTITQSDILCSHCKFPMNGTDKEKAKFIAQFVIKKSKIGVGIDLKKSKLYILKTLGIVSFGIVTINWIFYGNSPLKQPFFLSFGIIFMFLYLAKYKWQLKTPFIQTVVKHPTINDKIEIQKVSNKIIYITIGLNCILFIIGHFEQGSRSGVSVFGLFVGFIFVISFLVIVVTLIVKLIVYTNKWHKQLKDNPTN